MLWQEFRGIWKLVVFFQVQKVVDLQPRYFVSLGQMEVVATSFQIEILFSIFDDVMLLLSGNKHGLCFANFTGSLLP